MYSREERKREGLPSPEAGEFYHLWDTDDLAAARTLLVQHPEVVKERVDAAFLMHHAASAGKTEFVALLHEFGVDVNIPMSQNNPKRPIESAVQRGMAETAHWLIEHGSDINYGCDGEPPYCLPLFYALHANSLPIVKLLAEAGADLRAKSRNNITPLDQATAFAAGWRTRDDEPEQQAESVRIVEYLRSKGAKLSSELPGYVAPPADPEDEHPVARYADDVLGYSFTVPVASVLPEPAPVTIRGSRLDPCLLFTQGLSDRPLTVPAGVEEFQSAELVVPLDCAGWPEENDWSSERHRWVVQWLIRVAQIPFETNTWFGGQWGVISNEEPPQPLSEFTAMTCWLLLVRKKPLTQFTRDDGKTVVFYTMLPIHTDERDFALKEGIVPLLEKFAEKNVPEWLVPGRPSVMSSTPPVRPRGK